MISAGIDAGHRALKVAILNDGKLIGDSAALTGSESPKRVYKEALAEATKKAVISEDKIESIVATGAGAYILPFKQKRDVFCLVRGVYSIMAGVSNILDIGAMKALAVACKDGQPWKTATNTKCAAGVGMYLELVSDILMVKLEDIGELSLKWKENIEVSSLCAVFAETEIISLIHQKKRLEDILHGVVRALASQVYPLILRVNAGGDIALTGGVARNKGLVTVLKDVTKMNIVAPEQPELVSAIGAALIAAE